jgi:predicted nucleotidyltransferase
MAVLRMDVQALIDDIVERISQVGGVTAIVLGGSRARGTHTPTSDIDLGVYYHAERSLDLGALGRVAAEIDDDHRSDLLTPIGGWGPWIDGGGWLTVRSVPVDFLYRDLSRVAAVVEACQVGQVDIVYQPGHPHGFVSAIYMAEIAICQALWDPRGEVAALKAQTQPYPAALRSALIQKFAWEADFALDTAKKGVQREDVAYVAGCCFRSVSCMLQVIFALNGRYWLNEKGAVALAESFPLRPPKLQARIEEIFALLAANARALEAALRILGDLVRDTAFLTGG